MTVSHKDIYYKGRWGGWDGRGGGGRGGGERERERERDWAEKKALSKCQEVRLGRLELNLDSSSTRRSTS